ncbi:hypothetical protein ACN24M_20420 [Streptomyces microflavus]|uniref:hypothetical protein n=1 Tax=Streptomyces microflavus TaxID=1919 RepID=UPI003B211761
MKINEVQADARGKIYLRTEDGIDSYVTVKAALAEVDGLMMGPRNAFKEMSSGQGHHTITYRGGRRVVLKEIDAVTPHETDREGRRIVVAKGKRYIVTTVTPARPRTPGAVSWIPRAYVEYWSERNGETFGPTRNTHGDTKPGTVGRAIWDAVNP